MKQGTTPTLEFKLDIEISNVTEVVFTFTDELKYLGTSLDEEPKYLLQKNYPDDVTFEDDTFKLPLTQEETDLLTNTFFVEAQVICDKAVVKSDVKKVNMPHTLWTTYVDDNESDGQSEVIHLSFSDNVIVEGGTTSNYNDLTNKPRINNIELIGNKTTTDLGLDIEVGDGLKREGNVVSVDLKSSGNLIQFEGSELVVLGSSVANDTGFQASMPYKTEIRQRLLEKYGQYNFQPLIDSNNKLPSSLVSGVYTDTQVDDIVALLGNALSISIDSQTYVMTLQLKHNNQVLSTGTVDLPLETMVVDADYDSQTKEIVLTLQSGSTVRFSVADLVSGLVTESDFQDAIQDIEDALADKQDTIDSTHKLDADLVDDSTSTNKFVSAQEKQGWNAKADTSDIPTNVSELTNDSGYQTSSDVASAISGKEDKTTISTDTTSTTVTLTLADNHEYRYTQELTSLTLTMPNGDFIASVVFASGSTPTSMTYDSNIKWSGDDVTNGQFVPTEKTYNIVMWYDGLNINGVVRGV